MAGPIESVEGTPASLKNGGPRRPPRSSPLISTPGQQNYQGTSCFNEHRSRVP